MLTVRAKLAEIPGARCRRPEGAFYVLPGLPLERAPRAERDSEALTRFLLAEFKDQGAPVMVAPGSGFCVTPGLGTDEVPIASSSRVCASSGRSRSSGVASRPS